MNFRGPAVFVAVLIVGVSLAEVYADSKEPAKDQDDYYELLKVFVDTLDQVERNYIKDLSRRELFEAAIEGMISKLDQHSDYIAPRDMDRFRRSVESEYGGIGIEISKDAGGPLTIISPLVGSPAHRAGILAGDTITHIEGELTERLRSADIEKRIRGRLGTSIELTVRRSAEEPARTVKLTREMLRLETVLSDRRSADGTWQFMHDSESKIGYIRVTVFARHTASELRKTIRRLLESGMRGLILDLRNNPGGLLSAAIHVSDLFVSEGRIVSTEGRNTETQEWDAHRRGTFERFPMAVLVNQGSASASEIVAACLQDHKRAAVIGGRTFGKGSVQNIIELERGRSVLKLTTAGYKRPSGKNIHRFPGVAESEDWGVRPDEGMEIKVSMELRGKLALQRRRRASPKASDENQGAEHVDPVLTKGLSYVAAQLSKPPPPEDCP